MGLYTQEVKHSATTSVPLTLRKLSAAVSANVPAKVQPAGSKDEVTIGVVTCDWSFGYCIKSTAATKEEHDSSTVTVKDFVVDCPVAVSVS